jgi:hypothetical protein
MNKKFILSLCVILIFIIGLPMAFAQHPGTITTSTTKPVNSLLTYIKATSTSQTATSGGIWGLDSTTFMGNTRLASGNNSIGGRKVGTGAFNIAKSGPVATAGFIRFEEDRYDTTGGAFKFHVNDTIFLALQSRYSQTTFNDFGPGAKNRFAFANGRNRTDIGYGITGIGQNSMTFSIQNGGGPTTANVGTIRPDTTYVGKSDGLYAPLDPDTLGYTGTSGDSLIAIIINKVPNYASNVTPTQLDLTDVFLTTTGRWLQGATQCSDTLLVSYGRSSGNWGYGGMEYTITPEATIAGGGYYLVNLGTAGLEQLLNGGTYDPDDEDLYGKATTGARFDSLIYTMFVPTAPYDDLGIDTVWGWKGQLDGLKYDTLLVGHWNTGAGATGGVHLQGEYYYLRFATQIDSTKIDEVTVSGEGRAPVTVRRGGTYWTFNQGNEYHFDNKLGGDGDPYIGGAPILLLTLLPGDPAFVRWNVGFGGKNPATGYYPDIATMVGPKVRDDGRLQPTLRRINARGRLITATNISGNETPFTIEDTVTTHYTDVGTVPPYTLDEANRQVVPDTLFVFDLDSNLVADSTTAAVLIGIDSADGGYAVSSICWNPYGVKIYKSEFQAGRRIYQWGYDISDDTKVDRIKKIRLVGVIPNNGDPSNGIPARPIHDSTRYYVGRADTLNSAFNQALDGSATQPCFSSLSSASGNTVITIAPGKIYAMSILYTPPGEGSKSFTDGGININSAQAKATGHRLQVSLRDRCNNLVANGMVGIKLWGNATLVDTLPKTPTNGTMVVGGAAGTGSLRPMPTTDTLFLYARANAAADDRGTVQATFNTACNNNVIYLAFMAYSDSSAAIATDAPWGTPADTTKLLFAAGGQGDNTYKINITGGGDPVSIRLTNSANDYGRNSYPLPDTALISARSSARSTCDARELITFKIEGVDDCGRLTTFTNGDGVTFLRPGWVGGGWGSRASGPLGPLGGWVGNLSGTGTGDTASIGGRPNGTGLNGVQGYTWDTDYEREGYGTDRIGYYLKADGTGTILDSEIHKWVEDGNLFVQYIPPDIARDTVRIGAQVIASGLIDYNVIATTSTKPANFRLEMRSDINGNAIGDTALVVSRGDLNDITKTTYAYGVLRDCNNELVSAAYNANTSVFWRLEGTSRWSAFLFDPVLVYTTTGTGLIVDNPGVGTGNWIGDATSYPGYLDSYRGQRQIRLSINNDNGRAFVGINSDTVGGTRNVSGYHVFPIERGGVFGSEVYDPLEDSIYTTYSWTGNDSRWNRPLGLNENGAEVIVPWTKPATVFNFRGMTNALTTGSNADALESYRTRHNLRGYNELKATAYFTDPETGVTSTLTTTRGTQSVLARDTVVRYQVFADSINQIAWVDGTGDYFDKPIDDPYSHQLSGLTHLNLYGRQAAEIEYQSNTPYIIASRKVIAYDNKEEDDAKLFTIRDSIGFLKLDENSWAGGRSYAGRVVPLFVRIYDAYGNPARDISTTLAATPANSEMEKNILITKGSPYINYAAGNLYTVTNDSAITYLNRANNNYSTVPSMYWNQMFVGGSKNGIASATKVGAQAATVKFMRFGKLRGAYMVNYQTLSHAGNYGTYTGTTTGRVRPNPYDKQPIFASVYGTTLGDTALVYSKPTGELVKYDVKAQDASTPRAGGTQWVDWAAYDYAEDEYPLEAQLLWYDHRVYAPTQVRIASDNITDAPIKTLYTNDSGVMFIRPIPTNQPFSGSAIITTVTGSTPTLGTAATNFSNREASFNVTANREFTDEFSGEVFKAVQYSSRYLGGYLTRDTAVGGFFGGIATTLFTTNKAGEFEYAIIDSTEKVVGHLPYKLQVLAGPIHWIAMGNPNAVFPEKEALYPYPIRRLVDTTDQVQIQFNNTSTAATGGFNPWNEGAKVGTDFVPKVNFNLNPRSYTPPVDTVFVGHVYKVELRNYDRWGNRNTVDSIYLSLEKLNGFYDQSWDIGSEVLLTQDTRNKPIEEVADQLWIVPQATSFLEGGANQNGFSDQLRLHFNASSSYNSIPRNKPDLLNPDDITNNTAMIVGFRDIFVKQVLKPGTFTITSSGKSIVRLDDGPFSAKYTASKSTNLSDDGIKYSVVFEDMNGRHIWTSDGVKGLECAIDPEIAAENLGLVNGSFNRDLVWYIEAKNQWGMTTASSNSFTSTIEYNKKPNEFKAMTPSGLVNDIKIVSSSSGPLVLQWNTPFDSNGTSEGKKVNSHGKEYQLDTVLYKVVFTRLEQYPEDVAFDTLWGKELTLTTSATEDIQSASLNYETLLDALGEADNATYTWHILAKDRSYRGWDEEDFVASSDTQKIILNKVGTFAKVKVDALNNSTNGLYQFPVGDSVTFTLMAADADDNTIRTFETDFPGVNIRLQPSGATAPTSQKQVMTLSVNGKVLSGNITSGYTIPASYFINGEAVVTYKNTKAETVQFVVPDDNSTYKLVDGNGNGVLLVRGDRTRYFETLAGSAQAFTVRVVPRKAGTNPPVVYVKRYMEVIVAPSDEYENEINNVGQQMSIGLTARYSDEFENSIGGLRLISGRVNYYIVPNKANNGQWIKAYLWNNEAVNGSSAQFNVLEHAPSSFTLSSPALNQTITLQSHEQEQIFSWTAATDPNDKVFISSNSPTYPIEGKTVPDTIDDMDRVNYKVKFNENLDFNLIGRFATAESFRTTASSLLNLCISLGGGTASKATNVNWFVEAEDGLYITKSATRALVIIPEAIISVEEKNVIPEVFALGQNYPNPFNPTTTINYDVAKATDVKIVIYNILGQPVRTLVNERKEAARHSVIWDGKNDQGVTVATGTYIYQIKAGEFSATKKMNLLK